MGTLIIAPHMDDEAISCGGLIRRRLFQGMEVAVATIYGRVYDYGREDGSNVERKDFMAARKVLGYDKFWNFDLREGEPHTVGYYKALEHVEFLLREFQPEEVVIPAADDLNQDHRVLNHVCRIALRPINMGDVFRVLELFAVDGSLRQPTFYCPLSDVQLNAKLDAVAAYTRESRTLGPRAPDNLWAQAKVWGAACGQKYAEAYRVALELSI